MPIQRFRFDPLGDAALMNSNGADGSRVHAACRASRNTQAGDIFRICVDDFASLSRLPETSPDHASGFGPDDVAAKGTRTTALSDRKRADALGISDAGATGLRAFHLRNQARLRFLVEKGYRQRQEFVAHRRCRRRPPAVSSAGNAAKRSPDKSPVCFAALEVERLEYLSDGGARPGTASRRGVHRRRASG